MIKQIKFIFIFIIILSFLPGCNVKDPEKETSETLPLNVTVYLDLSDRLVKNGTSSLPDEKTQMERDTAIINKLEDIFIEASRRNNGILNSKNHFQVVFYPTPNSSSINTLAADLNVDLGKKDPNERKQTLKSMKDKFGVALNTIYSQTIEDKSWEGSDIWGFFDKGTVDHICIRKGYRNVLVILTDGYIYHQNNKKNEGSAYSYILDQTLALDDASLLVSRQGLDNLEVLMLEINPTDPKKMAKMTSTLETWFKQMGVKHFVVADTDIPQNVYPVIESFFDENN